MIRLLYISTARTEMGEAALEALLQESRMHNTVADITGLLVVGGRRFLQVLEGPDDAVTETYKRISADPRHFALVVLSNKPASDRLFPAWSMGYRKGSSVSERADMSVIIDAMVGSITDPTIRAYFEQFVLQHQAA